MLGLCFVLVLLRIGCLGFALDPVQEDIDSVLCLFVNLLADLLTYSLTFVLTDLLIHLLTYLLAYLLSKCRHLRL